MYDQIREDTLFLMFYASVAMLALIACCYLLFRRSNAIAPDVTPPARLRRWTAAFFATIAMCHIWYLPTYFLTSPDEVMLGYLIAGWLDCMTVIPLMIVILLTMLQDRRRPLWPVCVMMVPFVVGLAWCIVSRSDDFLLVIFVYFLLMWLGIIIYMVRAIRQYGRWLRDNYADLEHKEVWVSLTLLIGLMLLLMCYEYTDNYVMCTIAHLIGFPLAGLLLWRVETLSDLSADSLIPSPAQSDACLSKRPDVPPCETKNPTPKGEASHIARLLAKHCEGAGLYLQTDLTMSQLSAAIGVNRYYLSQYFTSQGISYYEYIHDLRVRHFIARCRELAAAQKPIVAQQLALESGYRCYSTFSTAFKQRMHKSVIAWMHEEVSA